MSLEEGTNALHAASPALLDGAVQLKDGTDQLKEGTGQLADGAEQLRDGIVKFDEEGISRITELLSGSLSGLTDRLEALKEADKSYNSFTSLPEGMEGSVKFIIRTESIKAE